MSDLVLVGASGHGKVVIDIVEKQGKYRISYLVDDNAAARAAVAALLESPGAAVTQASVANAALSGPLAAGPIAFEAVLVDCRMPGMAGFGFVEALRRKNATVPVVMMLAAADLNQNIDRLRHLHAGAYLIKPVKQGELLRQPMRRPGDPFSRILERGRDHPEDREHGEDGPHQQQGMSHVPEHLMPAAK